MAFSRWSPLGRSRSISGHSPRSSERKRSKSSSIPTGSTAVIQRIAHGTVGRRAAALNENVLFTAKPNDVPDDQEITGQVQFFDQSQLALDLFLCAREKIGVALRAVTK